MNEKLNKQEIKLEGTLLVPSQFEIIENKVNEAKSVNEILPDIIKVENIKIEMDIAKKELDRLYKTKLEEFQSSYKRLLETQKKYKALALQDAELSKIVEEKIVAKMNDDTGEVIKTIKKKTIVDLPKGIKYISGRISYDYKEDKVPDKFFKKTLMKTQVKKAIESGELPVDIAIPKIGRASISIDRLKLSLTLEEKNNG